MSRVAMKWTAVSLAAATAVSCLPGRFDDLEKEAWVQFAERNDSQASGDFGFDLVAVPKASGMKGLQLFVSSTGGAGLSQVTFDEHGDLTEQKGFNATTAGGGNLRPLIATGKFTAALSAWLGPNNVPQLVVGQSDAAVTADATGIAAKFLTGLDNGGTPLNAPTTTTKAWGLASAAGDLGTTASGSPDIVILSELAVTLFPGNGGAARSCGLKRPNLNNTITIPLKNVLITPSKQIVVAGRSITDEPRIVLIDPGFANAVGTECPSAGSIKVGDPPPAGFQGMGEQPPVALALGNVDTATGGTRNDLVAGFNPNSASGDNGSVRIYRNVAYTTSAPFDTITTTNDAVTPLYGSQIVLVDLDGDGIDEIVVGDPTASVSSVNQAGKVFIYKNGACSGTGSARGPVCLIQTLNDPSPSTNDEFGRAIVAAPFPNPDSKTSVLAVSEKNKVWVYFQTLPGGVDPRVK